MKRILLTLATAISLTNAQAERPPCINDICVGQALDELPNGNWNRTLDLKVVRRNPHYLALQGEAFFEQLSKYPVAAQSFVLASLTRTFDGSLIDRERARRSPKGYCASSLTLEGSFNDKGGRLVEVSVSGLAPPGQTSGFYVTRIKKVFGRDLDMKRLEAEIRKTWPDAMTKEFHEEESNEAPVVIDNMLGHLILQMPRTQRKELTQASAASDACAESRKDKEKKYDIN